MIKTKCNECGQILYRSPSKVNPRNFCDRKCQERIRVIELKKLGKKFRFKIGNKRPKDWTKRQTEKVSNERNYAWKGEDVSYVGLHAWIRRKLGKATKCKHCGKVDKRPRFIQWANIDHKYRRTLSNYISLCGSCHKNYDIAMKSNRDSHIATQS